jgi:integrase
LRDTFSLRKHVRRTNQHDSCQFEERNPYALRHSYATWALRVGLPTFTVARRMGTSVQTIEKHYGHLAEDAEEWELQRLESWSAGPNVAPEEDAQ